MSRAPWIALALLAASVLPAQRPDGIYAEIHTSRGLIVARLEMDLTPMTVANFVGLAEGAIDNAAFDAGRPFFDGTVFHRVVPGHVIQTGAPQGGRARNTGYTFPNEIHARLDHGRLGMLNMANSGPHTNSSQFCFLLGDRSYLDGNYTVFGEAVEGLDVIRRIAQGDTVERVRIVRVGPRALAFRPATESFRAMVRDAEARVAAHERQKQEAERQWVARHHPRAVASAGGILTERLAAAAASEARSTVRIRYRGTALRYVGDVAGREGPPLEEVRFASDAQGAPVYGEPEAFAYERGAARLNPGLDQVIGAMKPGERVLAIVPAAQAYGRAGHYAPDVPGRKRLVIAPHTMLVYEVEALPAQAR